MAFFTHLFLRYTQFLIFFVFCRVSPWLRTFSAYYISFTLRVSEECISFGKDKERRSPARRPADFLMHQTEWRYKRAHLTKRHFDGAAKVASHSSAEFKMSLLLFLLSWCSRQDPKPLRRAVSRRRRSTSWRWGCFQRENSPKSRPATMCHNRAQRHEGLTAKPLWIYALPGDVAGKIIGKNKMNCCLKPSVETYMFSSKY